MPGETILLLQTLEDSPVTLTQSKNWTAADPVLSQVKLKLQTDWQYNAEDELKPYFKRRRELSIHDGCILWGSRVVILEKGRSKVLNMLHTGHPGNSRMNRSYVWWPGIDSDLKKK